MKSSLEVLPRLQSSTARRPAITRCDAMWELADACHCMSLCYRSSFIAGRYFSSAPKTQSLCSDVRPWWCHQHLRRRRRWRVGLPKSGRLILCHGPMCHDLMVKARA